MIDNVFQFSQYATLSTTTILGSRSALMTSVVEISPCYNSFPIVKLCFGFVICESVPFLHLYTKITAITAAATRIPTMIPIRAPLPPPKSPPEFETQDQPC